MAVSYTDFHDQPPQPPHPPPPQPPPPHPPPPQLPTPHPPSDPLLKFSARMTKKIAPAPIIRNKRSHFCIPCALPIRNRTSPKPSKANNPPSEVHMVSEK